MKRIDRRTMLRGMLAGASVSVGLPFLEIFLDSPRRAAAQSAIPPRFGLFFWGNGVHPNRWVPTGEGANWELSDQLAPLADLKDEITVVSGMEVKVPNIIPHGSGQAGILSGAPLYIEGESNTFSAPSIDQVIADAIGGDTRFRSLEFGAEASGGASYSGPNSRNPPETDPYLYFERIFGAGFRAPGEEGEVDPRLGLRRSVLDAVVGDARSLQRDLGASDRMRLEQHLHSIRALELKLARLEEDPPDRAACMRPAEPTADFSPVDGRPQVSAKNRALCDITAMALACDQTRVFSNFITAAVNNILFPSANAGHHQLTHDEPGEQPQVHEIVLQLVGEFAYFLEALRSVPEGEGTLLDNCIVLGTTDVSYGRTHSLDEFPIVLAGTAAGALRKGLHYRSQSAENASKVHLTIMRALGMNAESFGEESGRTTDSIGALEV
jgi:hypothetical protein